MSDPYNFTFTTTIDGPAEQVDWAELAKTMPSDPVVTCAGCKEELVSWLENGYVYFNMMGCRCPSENVTRSWPIMLRSLESEAK